mgnify:CR=1 FL=1
MARQKINKTNVARLLDKAKVAYELIPYEVDESDLSAVHVAAQLGEDVERVSRPSCCMVTRPVILFA